MGDSLSFAAARAFSRPRALPFRRLAPNSTVFSRTKIQAIALTCVDTQNFLDAPVFFLYENFLQQRTKHFMFAQESTEGFNQ
ncbi:hypothetical protein LZA78_03260 [Sinirhodobacter sp. WL0062]|uniref:Uncharacterized protein n=1 Tax=Rhodobacter flavimaris TaxID=2907145 RepID=A0ABS8YUT3_9RHOB|nr:hypothetical protein [Sinirhodobacter sp. WL0062]MCE5972501.1 hypothetical protein [Sinirhodobacter sp. WL0062]